MTFPFISNLSKLSLQEDLIQEHRKREDDRRLAVDNAVKDLLNRDTQYRTELKNQVEEKLKKAESWKKQKEINQSLSLTESRK